MEIRTGTVSAIFFPQASSWRRRRRRRRRRSSSSSSRRSVPSFRGARYRPSGLTDVDEGEGGG
eukprot:764387-Hanusia_phi.AAC.1